MNLKFKTFTLKECLFLLYLYYGGDNLNYIKGNYRSSIYENSPFVIGLFKVVETNMEDMEDFVGKTITFKGNFDTLNQNDMYFFLWKEYSSS